MSSITKQRIGSQTYLYESISFRDKDGNPRNKKTSIGKIEEGYTINIRENVIADKLKTAGWLVRIRL